MLSKEFLIIAITTLITIASWVTFDIIHSRTQVKTTSNIEELTRPINPNFDLEGFNQLNE